MPVNPLKFENQCLMLLDQRKLPMQEVWVKCRDARKVHWAIRDMVVRGAPAIGVAGGYGLYLGMAKFQGTAEAFFKEMTRQAEYLKSARPTGVNLRNVIDAIVTCVKNSGLKDTEKLKRKTFSEARRFHLEDIAICRAMGRHGAKLFKKNDRVLTHCNAGALATTGYGTALGVIYACRAQGKKVTVYADETRPLLQGARLTAYELVKSRVPCTLLCDNMAASMMRAGKIDRIVVGADRIAANGDTANKIGTYNVAVLAHYHKIPFYIAAPATTFDFKIKTGRQIPIENRKDEEVTKGFGRQTAPSKVKVANPAFDVTPHELISAFITEAGVLRPPYHRSLVKIKQKLNS